MEDLQISIPLENHRTIIVSEDDGQVRLNIFLLGGHASASMTHAQAREVIEAMMEIMNQSMKGA